MVVILPTFVLDSHVVCSFFLNQRAFSRISIRSDPMAKAVAEMGGYGGRVLGEQVSAMKAMKDWHPIFFEETQLLG